MGAGGSKESAASFATDELIHTFCGRDWRDGHAEALTADAGSHLSLCRVTAGEDDGAFACKVVKKTPYQVHGSAGVRDMAWHGENHAFTVGMDGRLLLWSVRSEDDILSSPIDLNARCIAFPGLICVSESWDEGVNKFVASGRGDGAIEVWSMPENGWNGWKEEVEEGGGGGGGGGGEGGGEDEVGEGIPPIRRFLLRGHAEDDPVRCLGIVGGELVSGGNDGALIFWDCGEGKEATKRTEAHAEGIGCLAVYGNEDRNLVITGGSDEVVRVWDRRELRKPALSFNAHKDWIMDLAVMPCGVDEVCSAASDNRARIWSIRGGKQRTSFITSEPLISMATIALQDHPYVLTTDAKKCVQLWKA